MFHSVFFSVIMCKLNTTSLTHLKEKDRCTQQNSTSKWTDEQDNDDDDDKSPIKCQKANHHYVYFTNTTAP